MTIIDKATAAAWDEVLRQNVTATPGEGAISGRLDMAQVVRAVLHSLRDPDEQMAQSGAEITRNIGPEESDEAYRSEAANVWRFMIDEALSEN